MVEPTRESGPTGLRGELWRSRPSEPDADHADAGRPAIDLPRLHLVTPPTVGAAVADATAVALAAGAPLVQARTKDATDRARHRHVDDLVRACRDAGAMCIVNDRVDLALATGADGVHVGADDLPVPVARRLLGADAVIGTTCRNPESARAAVDDGADYLGVGPAYLSTTKSGLPDPLGPAGVARIASAVPVPVVAISGVTPEHVAELLDAGAWGVAVVAAVYDAADPAAAVRRFVELLP